MAQLTPPDLFAVTKGCRSRISSSAEVICPLCSETLTGDRMVREHERARQDRCAFRCPSCRKSFACSEDLRRHSCSTGYSTPVTCRLAATDSTPAEAAAQPTTSSDAADDVSSAGDWEIVQAGGLDCDAGRAQLTPLELFADPRGNLSTAWLTGDKMLSQHELSGSSRDAIPCTTCDKSFSCSEDLRRHSRSTGHLIPFTCRLTAAQPSDDSADHASSADAGS